VIHLGSELISFFPPSAAVRSLFVIGARRRTIIGIGFALVSPIGIAASGENAGMMSQPIKPL
jgi:hypothetical protein